MKLYSELLKRLREPERLKKLIDLGQWLSDKIADRFGRAEATAFVSGDGIGKPRGFLSYTTAATSDATRSWGVLEHVATGVSGGFHATLPGDALISLVFAMKAGYRRGASWLMNSKTIAATRKLKDGQGNYLWQQSVIAGQPDLLLGYPVEAAEDMPDIAASSQASPLVTSSGVTRWLTAIQCGCCAIPTPQNRGYCFTPIGAWAVMS